MGRPRKIRELNPVSAAVVKLRESSGLSQQAFSNQLGIAMVTVAKYEAGRMPTGKSLTALHKFASATCHFDLAKIFEDALLKEIGITRTESPFHPFAMQVYSLFARGLRKDDIADVLDAHRWATPYRADGEDDIGDQLAKAATELSLLLVKMELGEISISEVKDRADLALTSVATVMVRWVNLWRILTGGEPLEGSDSELIEVFRNAHIKIAKEQGEVLP